MVDICLIQPPIRDFYLTAKRTIPYGLACIAAGLEDSGFSVTIIDAMTKAKSKILPWPDEMAFLDDYYGPGGCFSLWPVPPFQTFWLCV